MSSTRRLAHRHFLTLFCAIVEPRICGQGPVRQRSWAEMLGNVFVHKLKSAPIEKNLEIWRICEDSPYSYEFVHSRPLETYHDSFLESLAPQRTAR